MLAVRKRPGSVLLELIVMFWHILKRKIVKGGRKGHREGGKGAQKGK